MPGDRLVGTVGAAAARELGVREGIPVVHALGDAGAATDGLVGSDPGEAYVYLGTTGWLAAVTRAPERSGASPIHSLVIPGRDVRLRIGAVQSAGASADWSRRTFLAGLDFGAVEALAAPADPAALAVRPLALPGLEGERAPVRDPDFRGAFVGIREGTQAVDLHLAVLTGVALALRHTADALGVRQRRTPVVGGAATSPAWRRAFSPTSWTPPWSRARRAIPGRIRRCARRSRPWGSGTVCPRSWLRGPATSRRSLRRRGRATNGSGDPSGALRRPRPHLPPARGPVLRAPSGKRQNP